MRRSRVRFKPLSMKDSEGVDIRIWGKEGGRAHMHVRHIEALVMYGITMIITVVGVGVGTRLGKGRMRDVLGRRKVGGVSVHVMPMGFTVLRVLSQRSRV